MRSCYRYYERLRWIKVSTKKGKFLIWTPSERECPKLYTPPCWCIGKRHAKFAEITTLVLKAHKCLNKYHSFRKIWDIFKYLWAFMEERSQSHSGLLQCWNKYPTKHNFASQTGTTGWYSYYDVTQKTSYSVSFVGVDPFYLLGHRNDSTSFLGDNMQESESTFYNMSKAVLYRNRTLVWYSLDIVSVGWQHNGQCSCGKQVNHQRKDILEINSYSAHKKTKQKRTSDIAPMVDNLSLNLVKPGQATIRATNHRVLSLLDS